MEFVEPLVDGSMRLRLRGSWLGLYQALGQLPPGVDPETGFIRSWDRSTNVLPGKLELVAPAGFEPATKGL